jgi:hypothetical protein
MFYPVCHHCRRTFEARSKRAKYCCNACKQAAYRIRRRAKRQAWEYCEEQGYSMECYPDVYRWLLRAEYAVVDG